MFDFIHSEKFKKLVRYVIIGGCTTAVNYIMMWILFYKAGVEYNLANAISIISSIVFAYVANKLVVFRSHVRGAGALAKEALSFFASRGVTFLLELGLPFLIHTIWQLDEQQWGMITKAGVMVLVLVLNFVFSQFIVFKGGEKE